MTENLFGMINDLAKKQSKQDETLQMILQLLKKFESANLTTNTPLLLSEASCVRRLYRNGITKIDEIQRIANMLGVSVAEMLKPID